MCVPLNHGVVGTVQEQQKLSLCNIIHIFAPTLKISKITGKTINQKLRFSMFSSGLHHGVVQQSNGNIGRDNLSFLDISIDHLSQIRS
jgi:hypothetical protein